MFQLASMLPMFDVRCVHRPNSNFGRDENEIVGHRVKSNKQRIATSLTATRTHMPCAITHLADMTFPPLSLPIKAGTQFSKNARLSLPSWLVAYQGDILPGWQ